MDGYYDRLLPLFRQFLLIPNSTMGLLPKPIREASCQWMEVYLSQESDKRRMDVGTCI